MEEKLLKKRWIYIINGFIVLLFMGCSYAWSIFVVPLETTYGWARSETSLAFTLNIIFFSVGSIFAGIASRKLSFSTLLKIAAMMIGLGFFTSSFARQAWQIFITYSFLCGTGIGIGYNCVVSSAPVWFPEKSGMVTGILLMGYALSTAILGPVINTLISQIGIDKTFIVLSVVCMVGLILGSFQLKIPTLHQLSLLPKVDRNAGKRQNNYITSEMIKLPIFWLYFFISAMLASIGLGVVNHTSPMLIEELNVSAANAALVISILSVCNGAGRFIWGIIYDKIGLKKVLISLSTLMLAACFVLYFSLINQSTLLFIVAACLLMFTFGGNATSIPTIIRELFGHRTFSLNYSVLCINSMLSAFVPTIVGSIQVATGNYHMSIMLLCGIMIVNFVFMILMVIIYTRKFENK
ncbi:MAG: OFA family MFS transporter [Faecalibacillus sp.]